MQFDEKDIEAVAKARVNRAEGNKTIYWIVGIVAAIVGGVFVLRYSVAAGWILSIAGMVAFLVYMQVLSKKQNRYKRELVDEWYREQEGAQAQEKK